MNENWMALLVAILYPKEITPEEAFDILETGPKDDEGQDRILEFEKLRSEGMTYGQIGAEYGLSKGTIYNHLKRRRLRAILYEEVE